jgi:hypothetical protein
MEKNVSVYKPTALTAGKIPGYYWIRGCVGPKGGVDNLKEEELFPPTGIRTPETPARSQVTVATIKSLI